LRWPAWLSPFSPGCFSPAHPGIDWWPARASFLAAISAALLTTMRRRLTAGPEGFAVRGPAGVRQVRWDQVVAIAAPTRRRRGLASTSLELDLDDDGLIVLGKIELGADPSDVAQELRALWRAPR
jgi:hypothetical protein